MTSVMTSHVPAVESAPLTIAAAALLARAVGRYRTTGTPLGELDIPMEPHYLRSKLGSGGEPVTADQAWDELLERGLICGTRHQWVPQASEEVTGHGA